LQTGGAGAATAVHGIYGQVTTAHTSGTQYQVQGVTCTVSHYSNFPVTIMNGLAGSVRVFGRGNVADARGLDFVIRGATAAEDINTISRAYGIEANINAFRSTFTTA